MHKEALFDNQRKQVRSSFVNLMGDILATPGGSKFFSYMADRSDDTAMSGDIINTPGGRAALKNYLATPSNYGDITRLLMGSIKNKLFGEQKTASINAATLLSDFNALPTRKKALLGVIAGVMAGSVYKEVTKEKPIMDKTAGIKVPNAVYRLLKKLKGLKQSYTGETTARIKNTLEKLHTTFADKIPKDHETRGIVKANYRNRNKKLNDMAFWANRDQKKLKDAIHHGAFGLGAGALGAGAYGIKKVIDNEEPTLDKQAYLEGYLANSMDKTPKPTLGDAIDRPGSTIANAIADKAYKAKQTQERYKKLLNKGFAPAKLPAKAPIKPTAKPTVKPPVAPKVTK